jgi:hypothetical protein
MIDEDYYSTIEDDLSRQVGQSRSVMDAAGHSDEDLWHLPKTSRSRNKERL